MTGCLHFGDITVDPCKVQFPPQAFYLVIFLVIDDYYINLFLY